VNQVVRMLCAGMIHGDLSEYNILLAADGPVIIDLPQAVDAAGNNHAQRMLLRDADNLREFFGRFDPDLLVSCRRNTFCDLLDLLQYRVRGGDPLERRGVGVVTLNE
jgi:serine/threonine-protein kinase RIO1